jgi:hypothetical protein
LAAAVVVVVVVAAAAAAAAAAAISYSSRDVSSNVDGTSGERLCFMY